MLGQLVLAILSLGFLYHLFVLFLLLLGQFRQVYSSSLKQCTCLVFIFVFLFICIAVIIVVRLIIVGGYLLALFIGRFDLFFFDLLKFLC